jgi:hypothetical protein
MDQLIKSVTPGQSMEVNVVNCRYAKKFNEENEKKVFVIQKFKRKNAFSSNMNKVYIVK